MASDACAPDHVGRLSLDLAVLCNSPDYADARISGVPVHRCILSARSPFLRDAFRGRPPVSDSVGDAYAVDVELKDLIGEDVEVGRETLVMALKYLYSGQVGDMPTEVCTCAAVRECPHVACRPVVACLIQVLYLAYVLQAFELVSHFERRILNILHLVSTDDLPFILSVAYLCSSSCQSLIQKCVDSVSQSDLDVVSLEKTLPLRVVKNVIDARIELGMIQHESQAYPSKHVRRILSALDSDDVELVRLLLKEEPTTLDDAYALHYAVAHSDSKVTIELLDLNLADVNLRNLRGYTVLHVAALRRDPKIIVSLLTKGARLSDLTNDGQKAVNICKKLTTWGDFYKVIREGVPTPNDRLCIEILEQAERQIPQIGEASTSLARAGDSVRGRLLYLENRVAFARMLFPVEAKVAMELAHVDGTLEFNLESTFNISTPSKRAVDLNDTPFTIKKEHLVRMKALATTVDLGKRFFPRCSEVLNKIMDDEITEVFCVATDATGEKRRRLNELQAVVQRAFNEDKKENKRSALSFSPSPLIIGMI